MASLLAATFENPIQVGFVPLDSIVPAQDFLLLWMGGVQYLLRYLCIAEELRLTIHDRLLGTVELHVT